MVDVGVAAAVVGAVDGAVAAGIVEEVVVAAAADTADTADAVVGMSKAETGSGIDMLAVAVVVDAPAAAAVGGPGAARERLNWPREG